MLWTHCVQTAVCVQGYTTDYFIQEEHVSITEEEKKRKEELHVAKKSSGERMNEKIVCNYKTLYVSFTGAKLTAPIQWHVQYIKH